MSQTAVTLEPGQAVEGQVDFAGAWQMIETGLAQEALAVGHAVTRHLVAGSAWNSVRHPDATGECTGLGVRGVVVWDPTRDADSNGKHQANRATSYLRRGYIWVKPEDTLTLDTNPFVRFVAAGAEQQGAFRSDADGSDAVAVTWAVVRRVVGALALLEINI